MIYLPYSFTVHPKTTRLDIELNKFDDSSYNLVSYTKLLNLELGNDMPSSDFAELTVEDTFDRFKDYEEESYIDNTEVYRDTFPVGKEPELGGFYINTGKLKLKSTLPESNSIDKNKKIEKKHISTKTKSKKESSLSRSKNLKHENTKVKVNPKMYSNIRLDNLLKAVRKQKKNDIVKSIKMPNPSKRCLVTSASRKTKGIYKIISNKNISSTKRCSEKVSSATNMVLNSANDTMAREGFISSKRCSNDAYSLTTDLDEIEVSKKIEAKKVCKMKITPKKKIHSSKKSSAETSSTTKVNLNSKKVTIPIEDFLSSKTDSCGVLSLKSDLIEVEVLKEIEGKKISKIAPKKKINSTNKCSSETLSTTKEVLNSTEVTIPREDFLSSKPNSYNALKTTSDIGEVEISKEMVHSVYKNNNELTFVKNNRTLKSSETVKAATAKEMFLSSNKTANQSFPSKSSLSSDTAVPLTSCKTKFSRKMFSETSEASDKMLPLLSLFASKLSHLPSNSVSVNSSPILDTNKALPILCPTVVPKKLIRSASQVGVEPNFVTITPASKTKNSTRKATISSKSISSNLKVTTDSNSTAINPLLDTSLDSSSSEATITAELSNFSKSTISKEVHHSSRKVAPNSAFISDNPVLNTAGLSPKPIIPKEKLRSSCKSTTESTGFQNISLTKTTTSAESSPANNKYSSVPGSWDKLTVNTANPKAVSKYMLNVIQGKNAKSSQSNNSTPLIPPNIQNDSFNFGNSLLYGKHSFRSYSKALVPKMQHLSANKNPFQPVTKNNRIATSPFAVSQTKQATVMNSSDTSCNNTSVNMYKMNISPIVKPKKPDGKF